LHLLAGHAAAPAPAGAQGFELEAYRAALAAARLDASGPLGAEQLAQIIERAEAQLALGRRDEAIALLAAAVEGGRFAPLAALEEGRAALYLLGDALGRAGAYDLARDYLGRLLQGPARDGEYRRAVARLVDLGLESGDPSPFVATLSALPAAPSPAL